MGWRLAEEVAWARPERPGPEWWTLLDLAQDARDETRQGMPGHEYLMARAKRSRQTIVRRLRALTDAKLIEVAARPAPGRRAIYEILLLHSLPPERDSQEVAHERDSLPAERDSQEVAQSPSLPPSLPPSDIAVPSSKADVEGVGSGEGKPAKNEFHRGGNPAEDHRQDVHRRLAEWAAQQEREPAP